MITSRNFEILSGKCTGCTPPELRLKSLQENFLEDTRIDADRMKENDDITTSEYQLFLLDTMQQQLNLEEPEATLTEPVDYNLIFNNDTGHIERVLCLHNIAPLSERALANPPVTHRRECNAGTGIYIDEVDGHVYPRCFRETRDLS